MDAEMMRGQMRKAFGDKRGPETMAVDREVFRQVVILSSDPHDAVKTLFNHGFRGRELDLKAR